MESASNNNSYIELDGTIRGTQAKETLNKLTPLLKYFGITRVANITGLDNINVPVYTCIRPMSKHLSVSQGKGLTKDLAKISAIMESIEGFHFENPPTPSAKGNFLELKKNHLIIDPAIFMTGFFDISNQVKNIDMPWIEAVALPDNKKILIPHSLINIDSTYNRPEFGYFSINSNGIAAGNTKDEAICHALYEIIERDAFFKWSQQSRINRDQNLINLKTITNKIIVDLIRKIENTSLQIRLWDISSELKIPSFHCAIYNTDITSPLSFFSGTGSHLNQDIAIMRAITEAVQTRTSLISGSRDDIFSDYYYQQNYMLRHSIKMKSSDGIKTILDCPMIKYENSFTANISQLLSNLTSNGYKTILLIDHTKSDINIPVVQILIPGMGYTGARV